MKARRLDSSGTFAVVFDIGDNLLEGLQQFFETERLITGTLYGIGGFQKAIVGYYDMNEKRYVPIEVDEQVEVVSFIGNVSAYEGRPRLHAHCTLGHRDGRTTGGHLLAATVCPTLELFVQQLPSQLSRTDRPAIGIPLLDLS